MLRLLLNRYLKCYKLTQKIDGFTLIELMFAMLLAFLVITPLMTFMLNIMNTDRKEQAKATSEQEIQSALDYIAQDLEQAVYIYDADALNNDNPAGIKDQIPPLATAPGCQNTTATSCIPVLVFWKREPRLSVLPVTGTSMKDDTFVYSLVAYYLLKGNNANETWSSTARIGRFQIRDGVKNPNSPNNPNGTPNYVSTEEAASNGFQLFDLSATGTTLKDKMNRWQKASTPYTSQAFTLVDFIDQNSNGITANCPENTQQVPSTLAGGFYGCVDSSTTSAQIYIRGNALGRIENTSLYSTSQSNYFPTVSIQIKGRGLLGVN